MTDAPHRCALCTVNDRDALIERLAAALWERRRHGTLDDRPWAEAGYYWQTIFREFAVEAIEELRSFPASN